ncbi:MAG TPA: hypothetical protein VMB71_03465, partial [Acetobacteraceae bacterium]|nr:hypothetical protein [Acetobacteraceae bacterium]
MNDLPTGQRGQITAATILALVLLLVGFFIVEPAFEWYGEREARLDAVYARVAHAAARAALVPG